MKETWEDIKGYEGFYQVSNLGRVKSLSRYVRANLKYNVEKILRPEKILKPFKGKVGRYYMVELHKEGIGRKYKVHLLVWNTFGDITKIGVIDHIDNDRSNNNINNLQCITQRENCIKEKRGKCLTGVNKRKDTRKYSASILEKGRKIHLGYFKTEIEAHQAYLKAKTIIELRKAC